MKCYKMKFTGTEKAYNPIAIKPETLPIDIELYNYTNEGNPIYYSEKTGQYYLIQR